MKLNLPNVTNARDLGGITTKYGVIKPNKLIRSGVVNRLTEQDVNILLADINLKRIVDLRADIELANNPDTDIAGVQHLHIPIIRAVTFGISFESLEGEAMARRLQEGIERMRAKGHDYPAHMREVYSRYVNDEHCRLGYGRFLKLLANRPVDGATLWHCTMGKDRCGTCAALLEHCLGADSDTIYKDYMESNVQTLSNTNSLLNKAKPYVDEDKLQLIQNMLMVQPYYFEEWIAQMDKSFGGIDGFICACGVTDEEIEKLRKHYLQ